MRSKDGKITMCGAEICDHKCCEFDKGNYIVLYPGELEEAKENGQSVAHLEIIDDDYHDGKKAICTAKDKATCDGGLKPLDCASYPLFPAHIKNGEVALFIKGQKCPLQSEHMAAHIEEIRSVWNDLVRNKPEVAAWLNEVELVGYEKLKHQPKIGSMLAALEVA